VRTYTLDVDLMNGETIQAPTDPTDLDLRELTRLYVSRLSQGSALFHIDGDQAVIVPGHAVVAIHICASDEPDDPADPADPADPDDPAAPADPAPADPLYQTPAQPVA
jgi:hypothetical protein